MLQPAGPGVEQREQHQGDARAAVVTRQPGECLAQARGQVDASQIPAEQLQAAVRRERLGHELDGEIALDRPSQARYRQTHQRGLQGERERMGMLSLKTFLIPVPHSITPRLFAVWG
jgi:hypothetical protein